MVCMQTFLCSLPICTGAAVIVCRLTLWYLDAYLRCFSAF
jgi:hypothetical protein